MVLFFYQRENLDFLVKNIPDIALHRLQLSRLIVSNNAGLINSDHIDDPHPYISDSYMSIILIIISDRFEVSRTVLRRLESNSLPRTLFFWRYAFMLFR